jgi:hypothetical protein
MTPFPTFSRRIPIPPARRDSIASKDETSAKKRFQNPFVARVSNPCKRLKNSENPLFPKLLRPLHGLETHATNKPSGSETLAEPIRTRSSQAAAKRHKKLKNKSCAFCASSRPFAPCDSPDYKQLPSPTRGRFPRHTGFSFIEILFAIFILGIGFIMIAALFPVAIRQTQATLSQTYARNVGMGGIVCMRSTMTNIPTTLPSATTSPTRITSSTTPAFTLPASCISAADQRFAWIPYYSATGTAAPYPVTLFVLVVQKSDQSIWIATAPPDPTITNSADPRYVAYIPVYDAKNNIVLQERSSGKIVTQASNAYIFVEPK